MTDQELLALMRRVDPLTVRVPPGIKAIADAIEKELDSRYAQDKVDAARYRWLRTAGAWESETGLNILAEEPDSFDAAVDAEMSVRHE